MRLRWEGLWKEIIPFKVGIVINSCSPSYSGSSGRGGCEPRMFKAILDNKKTLLKSSTHLDWIYCLWLPCINSVLLGWPSLNGRRNGSSDWFVCLRDHQVRLGRLHSWMSLALSVPVPAPHAATFGLRSGLTTYRSLGLLDTVFMTVFLGAADIQKLHIYFSPVPQHLWAEVGKNLF